MPNDPIFPMGGECHCVSNSTEQSDGTCACNAGLTFDAATRECIDCHSSCVTCSGGSEYDCLSCDVGYVREVPLAASSQCLTLTCEAQCDRCIEDASYCVGCKPGLTFI